MPDNVKQVQDLLQLLGLKHNVDNFRIQPVILPQAREKMNDWSFKTNQIPRLTPD